MTATVSSYPVISRVSLALLEDTGWYIPDYTHGSQLDWGHMQGCHFTDNSCLSWIEYAVQHNISTYPFCVDPAEKGNSTVYGVAKYQCQVHKYSNTLYADYKVRTYVQHERTTYTYVHYYRYTDCMTCMIVQDAGALHNLVKCKNKYNQPYLCFLQFLICAKIAKRALESPIFLPLLCQLVCWQIYNSLKWILDLWQLSFPNKTC